VSVGDRPVISAVLFREDGTAVAVGPKGVLAVAAPGHNIAMGTISGVTDIIRGYAATASVAITAVRATAYTEPSSAQQMQLVSSVNTDKPSGTGAHTVKITYLDGSGNGPYSEVVTMNGTTAVQTVATNIRFIERLDTLTIGSNSTNNGTISIQSVGGGTTFGTIAASDGTTFWSHHYVATGNQCFVTRLFVGTQGNNANFFIRYLDPTNSANFERQMTPNLRSISGQPSQMHDLDANFSVAGPARLVLYGKSDSTTANTLYGGFSFYEL
jgi:hypothetical protein